MKRLLSFLLALAMCVGMLPAGVWADPAQDGQTSEPPTEITAPVENTQPTETEAPTEAPTVEATETTEPEVTEPETTEPETVPETTEAEETQPETEEVQSDYGCEGLETAAFPDSLKTIENGAFFGSGLKKLTLGANVETVGSSAFGMCNLEELTILSDKVTFGESAIWTSGDLNALTVPASLRITQGTVSATRIGTLTLTGPGKMADYSEEQPPFWNSVENVIIEDSVTQLGRYGLAGKFINHVELPEGITDIPEGFLWNNQVMESVRLPASVTHIGNKAFGQMNSSGEQYPTIIFTGKNLPKLEANAFVGLKYDVICVYPCNWTTKPSGSYGGASVWGEVAWVSSHILTHYPAQPATEEKNGWLEHWKCDACGKLFLDEKGERPTTEEEIVDRVAGTYILTYENMEGIENPNPAGWSTKETLVLQAPRQPGFRFLGWSLDQAGRQIVDSIPAGERTEITLYAQWKVNTPFTLTPTAAPGR